MFWVKIILFVWVVTFVWGIITNAVDKTKSVKLKTAKNPEYVTIFDHILAILVLFDLGGLIYIAYWVLFLR